MTFHLGKKKKDFLYWLIECIVYLSNNIKKVYQGAKSNNKKVLFLKFIISLNVVYSSDVF